MLYFSFLERLEKLKTFLKTYKKILILVEMQKIIFPIFLILYFCLNVYLFLKKMIEQEKEKEGKNSKNRNLHWL